MRLFRDVPIVLLEHDPEMNPNGVSSVNNDATQIAVRAAEELIATGVTNFSYVPHATRAYWNRQREKDFSAILRQAGRRFEPWGETPFASRFSKAQQDRLIAARLKAFPKPIGLFCANDQVAERILTVAASIGLVVPNDMTVIGVDNDSFICENTTPTLTSLQPDFRAGGYAAARLLQRTIESPHAQPCVETYGVSEIVRRLSTQRQAGGDALVARARRLIAAGCSDPSFRTGTLVRQLNCSRSLLEMRFRDETGCSIREEVQRLRLAKAMELLRNPRQSITPVPSLCGYASDSLFKRLFKRTTGLTMREWQKRNVRRDD